VNFVPVGKALALRGILDRTEATVADFHNHAIGGRLRGTRESWSATGCFIVGRLGWSIALVTRGVRSRFADRKDVVADVALGQLQSRKNVGAAALRVRTCSGAACTPEIRGLSGLQAFGSKLDAVDRAPYSGHYRSVPRETAVPKQVG